MNIRRYYEQMRAIESELPEGEVLVVSLETPDGGRAGVMTEVERSVAARLIVEHRARVATAEEAKTFRAPRAKR